MEEGHQVYVDWHAPGPYTDDHWKEHCQALGLTYEEALRQPHAQTVFESDKAWLEWANVVVLVSPSGKSSWAEMGWASAMGKVVFALIEPDPERWDIMLQFADDWTSDPATLVKMVSGDVY